MEDVMGNEDLRREIWSYLRKKPKLTCTLCDQVLIWDKEVCEYHIFPYIISCDIKTVAICDLCCRGWGFK